MNPGSFAAPISVTAHAVDRYIERIEPCSRTEAKGRIYVHLRGALRLKMKTPTGEGIAVDSVVGAVFIVASNGAKGSVVKTVLTEADWSAKLLRHRAAVAPRPPGRGQSRGRG